MNKDFLDAYNQLDIENKRNNFSKDLMVIADLIKEIEGYYGKNNPNFNTKNYHHEEMINKTEADMLTFFYEDIYNIEKELITLAKIIVEEKENK